MGVGLESVLISFASNQKKLYTIYYAIQQSKFLYKKRNVKHRINKKIELIFKKVVNKQLFYKKLKKLLKVIKKLKLSIKEEIYFIKFK